MGNLSGDLNAIEKRLLEELTNGRESALQLRTLVRDSVEAQLAMKILRSFTEGLSMIGPRAAAAQIASAGGDGGGSKKPVVKDRRGCYKRTRSSDSWTKISPTTDDGHAWRKYGQKDILNSKHPRWYYRCTNKHQGCKATKQVQKIQEEPLLYQTTYFNHHTCPDTLAQLPHELILESDPVEPNLLSFRPNNHFQSSPIPVKIPSSEEHEHMVCFPHSNSSGTTHGPWLGPVEPGSTVESNQAWSPRILASDHDLEEAVSGLYSCASMTGPQHGLDTEVNQLIDIDFYEM